MQNIILTEENITKIKNLNTLLKKEEERIRIFADQLHLTLKKQKADKQIDDYNFDTCLQVFSENESCNKKHNVEEGDPFYEDKTYSLFRDFTDESFYTDDWNEGEHSLRHLHFCYTMHCLKFHSNLSWQDLLDINYVWIDLKVDYQFFVER